MNNHSNSEPRLDENPFEYVIQRSLLYQQNVGADAARQRSVGSGCGVTTRARDYPAQTGMWDAICEAATESAEVCASITTGNAPAKTYAMNGR